MKNTSTQTLAQLERIIEEGEQAALAAGRALKRIQAERLYEPEYSSFMSYLATRWKFSRQRAAQLIQMAETVTTHATRVDISKWPEGHVRPLAKLTENRQALAIQQFSALPAKQQTSKAMARVVQEIIRTPVNGEGSFGCVALGNREAKPLAQTPLSWYGGKMQMGRLICELMPTHNTYVEPFFGGGAVLFAKEPSKIEIVSDINHDVVNFFSVLRKRSMMLKLKKALQRTPFAREEHKQCCNPKFRSGMPIEDARRFFVRVRQSFSSIEGGSWPLTTRGEDRSSTRATEFVRIVDNLETFGDRLRRVQVECKCFTELLPKLDADGVFVYCDPPYPRDTRTAATNGYKHDMTDADHVRLLDIVCGFKHAKVLLSGYDCSLYSKRLTGWARHEINTKVRASGARGVPKPERVECLWRNYEVDDRPRNEI